MNTMSPAPMRSDPELLRLARGGDREAFGVLVARHQNLVASLAYSICGDFARSEDLAQETFLFAWRQLGQLQDAEKFRGWVSGIARNLALNFVRRRSRRADWTPEPLADSAVTIPTEEPDPHRAAVTAEESAVVWRALERLPENYRVPLVLFYREEQSVARVAVALEISEDAVKQRLARGREMLRGEVERVIARSLGCTTLGTLFTTSVLAALPLTMGPLLIPPVTGGAAVKATGISVWPWLGALSGPVLGLVGAWMGTQAALIRAGSEEERRYIRRTARLTWWIVGVSHVVLAALLALRWWQGGNSTSYLIALLAWIAGFVGVLGVVSFRRAREQARLFPRTLEPVALAKSAGYRSRGSFLGLPLVHVCFDGSAAGGRAPSVARGWIAMGPVAQGGLLAVGGFAIGPVAIGGFAVGGIALGGGAVGMFALGGLALGGWALGGAAVGWFAAVGGVAVARELAFGGGAMGAHANDAVAEAWAARYHVVETARKIGAIGPFAALLALLPGWLSLRRARNEAAKRRA